MNALSDNSRGALFMTICMAGFVLNDAMVKLVTQDMSLFQAIFLRGVLATLLVGSFAWWRGQLFHRVARADAWPLVLRVAGELGGTICYLTALMHIPIANATGGANDGPAAEKADVPLPSAATISVCCFVPIQCH